MGKHIDADELNKVKFHPLPYTHITPTDADAESYKRGWNDAIDAIVGEAPAADVVEVCRCKDCKHNSFTGSANAYCERFYGSWQADDYCSYWERKDG